MANIIEQADFNGHQLSVINHQNEPWFSGEQIGQALDYGDPRKAIKDLFRRHAEELSEYSNIVKVDMAQTAPPFGGGAQETRVYNEEGVMIITMLSRQPKAVEFRRWAVKVLKAHRRGELTTALSSKSDSDEGIKDKYIALLEEHTQVLKKQVTLLSGEKPTRPAPVPLTEAEKSRILAMATSGKGPMAIAEATGRSRSAIRSVIKVSQGASS